jgi:hypothetical protein
MLEMLFNRCVLLKFSKCSDGFILTALANARIKNFGQDFILARLGNWVVMLKDNAAAQLWDRSRGLGRGNGNHCCEVLKGYRWIK